MTHQFFKTKVQLFRIQRDVLKTFLSLKNGASKQENKSETSKVSFVVHYRLRSFYG